MRLPDFLIPGAPKCGSTTMFRWLQAHPDVFMPEKKEPNFFSQNWEKGIEWYADFFAEAGERRHAGECSVWYLGQGAVPGRVRETIPGVRLVFMLRDPAKRAWSEYWFRISLGEIDAPGFEEFIRSEKGERSLLRQGCYHELLQPWLDDFPREQMLFVATEAMASDPRGTWARTCEFLGIDPSHAPDFDVRHNETKTVGSMATFRAAHAAWRGVARTLKAAGLSAVADSVRSRRRELQGLLLKDGKPPEMDAANRAFLADFYAKDTAALERAVGMDTSAWTSRK